MSSFIISTEAQKAKELCIMTCEETSQVCRVCVLEGLPLPSRLPSSHICGCKLRKMKRLPVLYSFVPVQNLGMVVGNISLFRYDGDLASLPRI